MSEGWFIFLSKGNATAQSCGGISLMGYELGFRSGLLFCALKHTLRSHIRCQDFRQKKLNEMAAELLAQTYVRPKKSNLEKSTHRGFPSLFDNFGRRSKVDNQFILSAPPPLFKEAEGDVRHSRETFSLTLIFPYFPLSFSSFLSLPPRRLINVFRRQWLIRAPPPNVRCRFFNFKGPGQIWFLKKIFLFFFLN